MYRRLACALLLGTTSAYAQHYSAERPLGAIAQQLPDYLRRAGVEQHLNTTLPLQASFTDELGDTAPLGRWLEGRPMVIALVYYKCAMLCPEVLHGLAVGLADTTLRLGRDYDLTVFSIDPSDTAADAAREKAKFLAMRPLPGATMAIHFLTGSPASIQAISQATGVAFIRVPGPNGKLDQFAHSSLIMFVTPQGRLSRYLSGVAYLPEDVRLALLDASEKKISNPVDLFLTYCCSYNPAVGKYSFQVLRVVSLIGMVTLLVGAGTLYLLTHERLKQNV